MKNIALAQKVKELRTIAGSSQEELASATQLSLRTIQRIENGETQPRGDSLKRLALALGVTTEELARLMVPDAEARGAGELGLRGKTELGREVRGNAELELRGKTELDYEELGIAGSGTDEGAMVVREKGMTGVAGTAGGAGDARAQAGLRENKGFLMVLHLSALSYFLFPVFLLLPVLGILAPLVLWLLKRDAIKGVQREGRKILNFQISWFLVFMMVAGNVAITKILHVESVLDHRTMFRLLIGLYLFNVITVIVNVVRVGYDKAGIYRPAIPFMPNA